MKSRSLVSLPLPVNKALKKLGLDIASARRRRRISTTLMAKRAFISRTTLNKIEKGDPTVSLGSYATIIFLLGMTDRLATLIDPGVDSTGLALAEEQLPKRIHNKSRKLLAEKSNNNKSENVENG